jgi:succinyldiaminopimelate transaminase
LRPPELPDFPWDLLVPAKSLASQHPDGLVDLSVGTPVDPTPSVIQEALQQASDAPGYPLTAGSAPLVEAARSWLRRRLGAPQEVAVIPTVGSKELVALLPWLLGATGDVLIPPVAYPTYAVGARLAGCRPVLEWTDDVSMVWINSPANPTGAVMSAPDLSSTLREAHARGAIVVSDECYIELGWETVPLSVLDPIVCGGVLDRILAVHSLSKRSSAAGLRLGLVSGDPVLVQALLEVRKHAGLMVPAPVQAAGVAAFNDDEHVVEVRGRYAARRRVLRPALEAAGFRIDHSEAGLYLWATRDEPCWDTVGWLAARGILATPGEFYGAAGQQHVRLALTATDERIAAAAGRVAGT